MSIQHITKKNNFPNFFLEFYIPLLHPLPTRNENHEWKSRTKVKTTAGKPRVTDWRLKCARVDIQPIFVLPLYGCFGNRINNLFRGNGKSDVIYGLVLWTIYSDSRTSRQLVTDCKRDRLVFTPGDETLASRSHLIRSIEDQNKFKWNPFNKYS